MCNMFFCGFCFHKTIILNSKYDKEKDCVIVDKQVWNFWGIETITEYIYDQEDKMYISLKQEYNQAVFINVLTTHLRNS